MDTLAERLKTEREERGLTQAALAKQVGRLKHQSLIANLEAGTYKSSPFLPEIAFALGLQAMWLKTGRGPKYIDRRYETADAAPHVADLVQPYSNARPMVQKICGIAEKISDDGLKSAVGYLEYLAADFPLRKGRAA